MLINKATCFALGFLSLVFLELLHVLPFASESSVEILQPLLVPSSASRKYQSCKQIF